MTWGLCDTQKNEAPLTVVEINQWQKPEHSEKPETHIKQHTVKKNEEIENALDISVVGFRLFRVKIFMFVT